MPLPVGNATKIGDPYHGTHGASAPRNWESRNAYDFKVPKGSPVYAVADGVIGTQIGSLGSTDPRFAGLRLHLVTAGNEFYYAHLSRLTVKAGEHVRAGQVIGYSGVANGVAHLHFAAKHGDPLADITDTTAAPSAPTPPSAAPASATSTGAADPPNPYGTAPPVAGGVVQQGPTDPGVVQAGGFDPRRAFENWQQVASMPDASQETLAFLRNAQIASGG